MRTVSTHARKSKEKEKSKTGSVLQTLHGKGCETHVVTAAKCRGGETFTTKTSFRRDRWGCRSHHRHRIRRRRSSHRRR